MKTKAASLIAQIVSADVVRVAGADGYDVETYIDGGYLEVSWVDEDGLTYEIEFPEENFEEAVIFPVAGRIDVKDRAGEVVGLRLFNLDPMPIREEWEAQSAT